MKKPETGIIAVDTNVIDFVLMEDFGMCVFSGYSNPFSS